MTREVATRYVQSGKGKLKKVGDETAVYVEAHKGLHVLNETALLIYEAMAQPARTDQVVQLLVDLTGEERARIEGDVGRTVRLYLKHGLIEEA